MPAGFQTLHLVLCFLVIVNKIKVIESFSSWHEFLEFLMALF